MIVYHCTREANLYSILKSGVSPLYSQGRMPVVWVCTADRKHWGCLHTVRRHGGTIQEVVILQIEVPEEHLTFSGKPGLFYTRHTLTPEQIVAVERFSSYSSSPLEEV